MPWHFLNLLYIMTNSDATEDPIIIFIIDTGIHPPKSKHMTSLEVSTPSFSYNCQQSTISALIISLLTGHLSVCTLLNIMILLASSATTWHTISLLVNKGMLITMRMIREDSSTHSHDSIIPSLYNEPIGLLNSSNVFLQV